MLFGSSQYNPPSRFLEEIPASVIQSAEGSRGKKRKLSTSFGKRIGSTDDARQFSDSVAGKGPGMFSSREYQVNSALKAGAEADSEQQFRVGDDVRHGKFGDGVILDINGAGEKAQAVIRFPGFGEKQLLLSWTPLEKI